MSADALRRTPLHDTHKLHGARLVGFAGWEMPVQYKSALDEHHATRKSAGLFDVSHMGEVFFEGPGALASLQSIVTNDLSKCADGQAQYTSMLREHGGIIDDLVVYRFRESKLLVCVNAGNRAKDAEWLIERGTRPDCAVTDRGDDYAQLAVQGPQAASIVQKLTKADLSSVKTYWFTVGEVAGFPAVIARTGYTGEDGFELFVAPHHAAPLWNALITASDGALVPAGLGARDSLRLESAYRLYGNDMDETTTPLECGLGWITRFDKGDFIGRDALLKQKAEGITRKLVGFKLTDRGIARHDYPVLVDGTLAGKVTSGTLGPTVQQSVGLAYVPATHAAEGSVFDVEIRGKPVPAVVVKTPFYKRDGR